MKSPQKQTLPLEIWLLVIQSLVCDGDRKTLFSLLLVNKAVSQCARHEIYRDPFRFVQNGQMLLDLLELLLPSAKFGQLPPDSTRWWTGLVSATRKLKLSFNAFSTLPTNYLSLLRSIHLEQEHVREAVTLLDKHCKAPMQSTTHLAQFNTNTSPSQYLPFPDLIELPLPPHHYLRQRPELTRAMTLRLVERAAEQIQTLTIPLLDIQRYINSVEIFSSLQKVVFETVAPMEMATFNYGTDTRRLVQVPPTVFHRDPQRQPQWMHAMEDFIGPVIHFVHEHSKRFKGQLRTVDFAPKMDASLEYLLFTPPRFQELLHLLPPLSQPRSLEGFALFQAIVHSKRTDLRAVERITLTEQDCVNHQVITCNPLIFQQCRSLCHLEWLVVSPTTFAWAAQERREWDRYHANPSKTRNKAIESQQQQPQTQPLVPLKTAILRIAVNAAPAILDDLTFAFSRTLTRLCLSFELTPSQAGVSQGSDDSFIWKQSCMGDGQPLEWSHLCVGQHWPSLPRLVHLQVTGHGQEQIWLLPGALSTALETLSVIEKQTIENLEVTAEAEAVWITPAKLPRLKRLTLLGTPAVTFHPDTLSSTTELEELVLGTRYRHMDLILRMCYETGLGDQVDVYWKHEKLWTRHAGWDWRLPQLVHLELEGIFASTFQFQWLDYCPALKRLYLMTGQDSPRMIQKRDLERNGTLIISHGALEKFKVSGSISIQDEALVLIREIVFPSLVDLDVPQTKKTV